MQGRIDAEIGRRADRAGVGREAEQHDGELARRTLGPAQLHELGHPGGQHRGPLGDDGHVAAPDARGLGRPAPEGHRPGGAVEFGDRHHHGGLDRREAADIVPPLLDRLELDRMGRQIGHVEPGQDVGRRRGVVIGRAADQREPGQRHQRVDGRHAIAQEIGLESRAGVETAGEGRDHAQALGLERRDDAVIMGRIASEHVGAHHQQPDRSGRAAGPQMLEPLDDAPPGGRMVEPDLRIEGRRRGLQCPREMPPLTDGIARDQQPHEARQVLLRPGQPILQGEEVVADVLGGARNEAQQARQLAQHLHLPLAARGAALLGAAQALQEADGTHRLARHRELAEAGQLHDLPGRHGAEHGVAGLAAGRQCGLDGPDVLVEEQHGGDDDVAARDGGPAPLQRRGVAAPFVGRVDGEVETRELRLQRLARPIDRAGEVAVHRHDDDAERRRVSDRNALWHRTGSRR